MKWVFVILVLGLAAAGCTTKSEARLEARDAYLAGQNELLRQQQAEAQMPSVTIVGPVQNHKVPWVDGLTLAQALATANYLDSHGPKQIIITRDGESATLDPKVLFNGAVVPLVAGDVVELRQ
jgi:hypothetical protein